MTALVRKVLLWGVGDMGCSCGMLGTGVRSSFDTLDYRCICASLVKLPFLPGGAKQLDWWYMSTTSSGGGEV